jgi:uncharacterized metal-binding protein YceD (DUF177 family)
MIKRGEFPWSVVVAVHDVPETGRRFDLAADQHARKAIAAVVGLRSLPRLEATFDVTRRGREGLRVVGRISATVAQTCVVTLEPIESTIEEEVDVAFVPSVTSAEIAQGDGASAKIIAEDMPESLVDGTVDLGALATEFLLLGIDPYPRKPGATFEAPVAEDAGAHPFAALAALKKGQSNDGR